MNIWGSLENVDLNLGRTRLFIMFRANQVAKHYNSVQLLWITIPFSFLIYIYYVFDCVFLQTGKLGLISTEHW